jgi:ABC-type cobalamin/Fe3+-siderophores transport system ATPase subunit
VPDDLWVRDVVALGRVPYLGAWGRPGADDLAAIDDALHAMGISSLAARPVASLSGGERQRVLVARLLAARAPIWILDEPTTGLDIRWSSELHETLRHCAAQGHTIVMAMHGIESVLEVADDVLVLGLGLGSSGGDATVSTRDRSSQDARLDASRDAAPEHAFGPAAATLSATTLERAFGLAFEMTATLRPLARRHPASGEARAIAAP